jgi:hypothetical protein
LAAYSNNICDMTTSNVVSISNGAIPQCGGTTGKGTRCRFNARVDLADPRFCSMHQPRDIAPEKVVAKMTMAQQLKAAEQQIMDLVPVAMQALTDVLMDPLTKPADRIKAAQMVIDRSVAQRIQVENVTSDTRDLDEEIEEALEEVRDNLRTGTDG